MPLGPIAPCPVYKNWLRQRNKSMHYSFWYAFPLDMNAICERALHDGNQRKRPVEKVFPTIPSSM